MSSRDLVSEPWIAELFEQLHPFNAASNVACVSKGEPCRIAVLSRAATGTDKSHADDKLNGEDSADVK